MTRDEAVAALREGFAGDVLLPDDGAYEGARHVFNAMIDRRPALIARCASSADVVAAVNLAREQNLTVAVRGGGHSASGQSMCDDGIVIDLSGMKSIHVDPKAKTARAGGGVLWGEFDAATQEHGLHTPGGRVTTTGIGGFTTGGGYGWTSSKYGLACDNLIGPRSSWQMVVSFEPAKTRIRSCCGACAVAEGTSGSSPSSNSVFTS